MAKEKVAVIFMLDEQERELLRALSELHGESQIGLLRAWIIQAGRDAVGDLNIDIDGRVSRVVPNAEFLAMAVNKVIQEDRALEEEVRERAERQVEQAIERKRARSRQLELEAV